MTNAPINSASLRGAVDLSSLVRPPAPAQGAAAAAATGGAIRSATDATFGEILDLSSTVPVVVEFVGQGIESTLGPLIQQYSGRIALATVDGPTNPQLVQAFQVTQVPTVAAVVAGRPIQLFPGMLPEPELRDVLEQLLQLAAQQNVTGTLDVGETGADGATEPVDPGASVQAEEPLPPHHQEAYDAITAGDFATAVKEYETAIAQNPRDQLAVAGLAQVSLLARLDGADADDLRSTAAAHPDDVAAQLAVADLDVSGGHVDDAFGRLLDLFSTLDAADKNRVRTRLLDYFEIAGADDARVIAARRRLAGLLY
ncbi:MAG: tetratricopeptide repeat protein [Rhodoglobus sp.]